VHEPQLSSEGICRWGHLAVGENTMLHWTELVEAKKQVTIIENQLRNVRGRPEYCASAKGTEAPFHGFSRRRRLCRKGRSSYAKQSMRDEEILNPALIWPMKHERHHKYCNQDSQAYMPLPYDIQMPVKKTLEWHRTQYHHQNCTPWKIHDHTSSDHNIQE